MKSDERKTSEQYRVSCDESKEIMEASIYYLKLSDKSLTWRNLVKIKLR